MTQKTFLLLLLPFMVLAACTKDRITGSGAVVTETRPVSDFTQVETNGNTQLFVSQDPAFEVKAEAYGNLLPYLETKVSNGVLSIGYRNNTNIRNDNSIVYVTMPVLESLESNGSGNMSATGSFASEHMRVSISGSSQIEIAAGTTNHYSVTISGSGRVKSFGLLATHTTVDLSGSGEAEVFTSETLDVHISGSGIVYYKGNPAAVNSNISGSGKIIKR